MNTDTIQKGLRERQSAELQKHAEERDQFIARIKKMVGQPVDNIHNPVPLFSQLRSKS